MILKKFKDVSLSMLGLGCMRLPVVDGDSSKIDVDATEKMIGLAFEKGVNYFDTAYVYHGGTSESVIGEIFKKYNRESFYVATKFPGFDKSKMENVEKIFEEQLSKMQLDYFDFYLFHNVCESNIDDYLDPKYGIFDYLKEQKKNGRIKHLGFSCHGSIKVMKRFLDAYGDDLEFVQIELNYLDWKLQDANLKVEELNRRGIPIWVMEPLRGGKLANVDLRRVSSEMSAVEIGFRYLQGIKGVTMILSGMSNLEQFECNVKIFETEKPLSKDQLEKLEEARDEMLSKSTLPCTECRYCTEYCPKKIEIPKIIAEYNEKISKGEKHSVSPFLKNAREKENPKNCIGCKSCEKVCPQKINISQVMKDIQRLDS